MTATMLSPPASWTPWPTLTVRYDVAWADSRPAWPDPTADQAIANIEGRPHRTQRRAR